MSKQIQAPAIVHGDSDKNRTQWFKEAAADWKRKGCSVQGGKGSRSRTDTGNKAWRDGWDAIFGKDKKK